MKVLIHTLRSQLNPPSDLLKARMGDGNVADEQVVAVLDVDEFGDITKAKPKVMTHEYEPSPFSLEVRGMLDGGLSIREIETAMQRVYPGLTQDALMIDRAPITIEGSSPYAAMLYVIRFWRLKLSAALLPGEFSPEC